MSNTPDRDALAAAYWPFALRRAALLLRRYPRPPVEAEDLASLAMFRAVTSYDPQGSSFVAWLGARLKYDVLDAAKHANARCRREPPRVPLDRVAAPDPAPAPGHLEGFDDLTRDLPPWDRELLRLVFVEGYTRKEVAAARGRSPAWGTRAVADALKAARPRAEAVRP